MSFETDNWPFVPAQYQKHFDGKREVLWIVIHSMEAPESEGRARQVARYFQHPTRPGSSHLTIDNKEIIQCVRDNDIAAGAVGANQKGIHIEQPGFAKESREEWLDDYSKATIELVAEATAQYCLKYDIPVRKIEAADLKAGTKGICGHADVSRAFPGTGHTDPGQHYPWDYLIERVQAHYETRESTT